MSVEKDNLENLENLGNLGNLDNIVNMLSNLLERAIKENPLLQNLPNRHSQIRTLNLVSGYAEIVFKNLLTYMESKEYPILSFEEICYINNRLGILDNFILRNLFIERFGFPILTHENIINLSQITKDKTVLELGSGTGYLSYLLEQHGVDIKAIDNHQTQYAISEEGKNLKNSNWELKNNTYMSLDYTMDPAIQYIKNTNVIIMSWPDYRNNNAIRAIKHMVPGQILIYQGEGYGGCTATNDFFNYIKKHFNVLSDLELLLNRTSVSWNYIHDQWYVFVKK